MPGFDGTGPAGRGPGTGGGRGICGAARFRPGVRPRGWVQFARRLGAGFRRGGGGGRVR